MCGRDHTRESKLHINLPEAFISVSQQGREEAAVGFFVVVVLFLFLISLLSQGFEESEDMCYESPRPAVLCDMCFPYLIERAGCMEKQGGMDCQSRGPIVMNLAHSGEGHWFLERL